MKTENFKITNLQEYLKTCFLVLAFFLSLNGFTQNEEKIRVLLENFADDYQTDPSRVPMTFGLEIDGSPWHVVIPGDQKEIIANAKIEQGFPATPAFYYVTSLHTLEMIEQGKMNAMTAGVKAFSTDYAPLDIEVMEGFQPSENFVAEVLSFTFHFWTKGVPEVIPFGPHYTRATHGAQAAIFYYDKSLRTGYGYIHPGQHANENPNSKTNPFASMVIVISGKVIARLDGKEQVLEKGKAVFIPPGMSHEFLNPYDEGSEFILLMFGEGA